LEGGLPQAEAALIAGIEAGQSYFNIHTLNNPGGEIRSQLFPACCTRTDQSGTSQFWLLGVQGRINPCGAGETANGVGLFPHYGGMGVVCVKLSTLGMVSERG
jgi:hypothetical protein